MGCIGHDFEIIAVTMDRFAPRDDRKTANHTSVSWLVQRGNPLKATASSVQ
jgi:hypothetical protein